VIPVLPRPVALPEPPGSAAALGAVVEELASAGYAAGRRAWPSAATPAAGR
jgi:hypothetical protein